MFRLAVIVLAAMVSPAAGVVSAQEVPRAFRGLFRPSDAPANSRHRVDLSTGISGGYAHADLDSDPLTDAFDLRLYQATLFGTSPVLQYTFTGERAVFGNVAGGSFARYGGRDWRATRYFNHLRVATPIGPRTNVALRGLASYSPFYTFDLSVDPEREDTELLPADEAQPMAKRSSLYLDVAGHIRHRLSTRSEVSLNGGFAYTTYSTKGLDSVTPSGSLQFSRQMTEHARLQLGYGFRQWHYPGSVLPLVRTHNIITGISYSRPLPFARRTQVGFDLGSAVAQTPKAWRYDLTGGAFVLQPLGRAWAAVGNYRRGLDGRTGLSAPLYLIGDTVALTVGGLVGRRVVVRSTGTFFTGTSLFDELQERSRWWSATTSVSTLVLGVAAAYLQIGWTGQRFAAQVGQVSGLPTVVDRFSVFGGLSVGLPLVR